MDKKDLISVQRTSFFKYTNENQYPPFEWEVVSNNIELKNGKLLGTFVIKKALEKIIEKENKQDPLSDESLVSKLETLGYNLARRTIAKYRDQMGYPVARLRKEI